MDLQKNTKTVSNMVTLPSKVTQVDVSATRAPSPNAPSRRCLGDVKVFPLHALVSQPRQVQFGMRAREN